MKLLLVLLAVLLPCCLAKWNDKMEHRGNKEYFEGDVRLTPEQRMRRDRGDKNVFGSVTYGRWPLKIPYTIRSSRKQGGMNSVGRQAIADAIEDYHKYTCIRFHKRKREKTYMEFFMDDGCWAFVGKSDGKNPISIGVGCEDKGTVLHEIGHSLGLQHEQARPDRSKYVRIHWNNIEPESKSQFYKESDIDSLGTPYDLQSIMHYSSTAFSKNGKKTITTKVKSKQHYIDHGDQVDDFSKIDIEQLNLMYGTKCMGTKPKPTEAPCEDLYTDCLQWTNEGYCDEPEDDWDSWMKSNCCASCSY